jgi:hypothetical protein
MLSDLDRVVHLTNFWVPLEILFFIQASVFFIWVSKPRYTGLEQWLLTIESIWVYDKPKLHISFDLGS